MALLNRKMPVQTDCGSELDTEKPQDPFGLKYQAPSDHRHFVVARIHENIDPNDFGKTEPGLAQLELCVNIDTWPPT